MILRDRNEFGENFPSGFHHSSVDPFLSSPHKILAATSVNLIWKWHAMWILIVRYYIYWICIHFWWSFTYEVFTGNTVGVYRVPHTRVHFVVLKKERCVYGHCYSFVLCKVSLSMLYGCQEFRFCVLLEINYKFVKKQINHNVNNFFFFRFGYKGVIFYLPLVLYFCDKLCYIS